MTPCQPKSLSARIHDLYQILQYRNNNNNNNNNNNKPQFSKAL